MQPTPTDMCVQLQMLCPTRVGACGLSMKTSLKSELWLLAARAPPPYLYPGPLASILSTSSRGGWWDEAEVSDGGAQNPRGYTIRLALRARHAEVCACMRTCVSARNHLWLGNVFLPNNVRTDTHTHAHTHAYTHTHYKASREREE